MEPRNLEFGRTLQRRRTSVRRAGQLTQEVELRTAATVMLVRDGEQGLETFMLRRNPKAILFPVNLSFREERLMSPIEQLTRLRLFR